MDSKDLIFGISTSLCGVDCYLDRLSELKNDGITQIEICLREDIKETEKLFDDAVEKINYAGLKVRSIHLPFGNSVDPSAENETDRLKNLKKINEFINLTKSCGARVFVIHGSYEPVALDETRKNRIDACVSSMRSLCKTLNGFGIKLAVENLPRTCIGNSISEIAYITDRLPDLGVCFDTNHMTMPKPDLRFVPLQRTFSRLRNKLNPVVDTPESFAEKFAGKICALHISDYDGINERHWLPGQGIVNFKSIHQTLLRNGFDAPFMFEPNEKCRSKKTTGKLLIDGYSNSIK